MPPTPPIIRLRKSIVGQVVIWTVGLVSAALLVIGSLYIQGTNPSFGQLLFVGAVVVLLATVVQSYSYNLSLLTITSTELRVSNWGNVLNDSQTVTEWSKVTDVNVNERGVLAQMFGFGTITVEAESGSGRLTLPYVPDADHWRDVMIEHMESAPETVHEV